MNIAIGVGVLFSVLSLSAVADGENCSLDEQGKRVCTYKERLTVQWAGSMPGKFAAKMIFLADQLERNVDKKSEQNAFIVGSFTSLNDLSETSPLGRLLEENLIHELQVRQWKIYEARLMKNVLINNEGEFVLSRDVKRLNDEYQVSGMIAGTYIISNGVITVNARVVDIKTGVVISSGQILLPPSDYTDELLINSGSNPKKAIKIIGG